MWEIYTNRKEILKDYFNSIGITEEYNEVDNNLTGEMFSKFSPYCLK